MDFSLLVEPLWDFPIGPKAEGSFRQPRSSRGFSWAPCDFPCLTVEDHVSQSKVQTLLANLRKILRVHGL